MELRMFGGLRLERDGRDVDLGRPRQRFVLAVLAIEANRVVATDRLTDLLWERDGEKERASLHAYISNLRRVLEPERDRAAPSTVLVRQSPGYRLAIARSQVDALRFEDLVERGIAAGDLAVLREAIGLWVDPLAEMADEPVVVEAVGRWHGLLGAALEAAADLFLRAGDAAPAEQLLSPHLSGFPLRERMAALAAGALYRTGRQADALRVIERARSALADVAGLELGSELKSLERRILEHAPDLGAQATFSSSLFGRDDELAALRRAAGRLGERRGGVVTVTGPSGIGKTALVEDLTFALAREGNSAAWARCPEAAAVPPFWPLAKVGLIDADAVTAGDPFAHAQWIARDAAERTGPRVLVIDDLQWADADTLRVLTHLAAELRHTSTVLITTARPLAIDSSADLVACMAELSRQRVADVVLGELSEADVAEWLGERGELAGPIHARTGGNPFFVREVIGLMGDGGLSAVESVPPGVQAVVRRRVSQLSPRVQKVLQIACLLGSPFEGHVISELLAVGGQVPGHLLEEAVAAGLVVPDPPSQHPESVFRFSHAIVREALAAEIKPEDRASLHAELARALLIRHPDDAHAGEIAFHAAAGASAGTAALAVDASRRAAALASAHGAHSDAARHWAIVAATVEGDEDQRLDALVSLAAAHERADEMREARTAVVAAIDLARGLRDWPAVGAAAAALNHASIWPNQPYPAVDHELVALLEDALRAMPKSDSPERVLTLGALGTELMHSVDGTRRDTASRDAIAIARGLSDPQLLAKALHARTFSLKQPAAVEERRRVALELRALADGHDLGADVTLLAELQVALADLALGDITAVADRLPRCISLLDLPVGLALRSQLGFFRVLVEVIRGRYGEAIDRASEVHELFRRTRPAEAEVFAFAQRLTIGHDLGDLTEADLQAANSESAIGFALALQLYSAILLFDLGRRDEAIARVPYRRGEVPDRALDYVTVFIDVAAAHVAAELGDAAAVPALLARLEPMAGRWANAGTGAGSLGLVDLAIARLHATGGDEAAAREWFASAVDRHERIGAPAWLARSLLHQGVFLGPGGAASLDRAAALADTYGLPIVTAQVARALA